MTIPPQTFSQIPFLPQEALYQAAARYAQDEDPHKILLGGGVYREEHGLPWTLPAVLTAKSQLDPVEGMDHEYLGQLGLQSLRDGAARVVWGTQSKLLAERRVATCQSVSGTGAVYLGIQLLKLHYPKAKVYITLPSWPNHVPMFSGAGFEEEQYKYFDNETRGVDFAAVLLAAESAPLGSIFVLHGCAHNPTGADLDRDQWRQLGIIFARRRLFPFFDIAYQGFATGSLDNDAWAVRHFTETLNLTAIVAQSFSKSMGLYGERAGCVHLAASTPEIARAVTSQFGNIARRTYSNPPAFGGKIASRILNDQALYEQWEKDLIRMSTRIRTMRQLLVKGLKAKGTPGDWVHLEKQIGMFAYTGLTPAQVSRLEKERHIYMADTGRISVAGLNEGNIQYFVDSVDAVVRET